MNHQFELFGWQKPKAKVPISKARIEEVKAFIEQRKGTPQSAVAALREVREGLENHLNRISNAQKYE